MFMMLYVSFCELISNYLLANLEGPFRMVWLNVICHPQSKGVTSVSTETYLAEIDLA